MRPYEALQLMCRSCGLPVAAADGLPSRPWSTERFFALASTAVERAFARTTGCYWFIAHGG